MTANGIRKRGRPRKQKKTSTSDDDEYTDSMDTHKRTVSTKNKESPELTADLKEKIEQEYFSTPQLLSYNPWHSTTSNGSHNSYNPEVKFMHFNGMTKQYKAKFKASSFGFTNFFSPDIKETSGRKYNAFPSFPDSISNCVEEPLEASIFQSKVPLSSTFDLRVNTNSLVKLTRNSSLKFPKDENMRTGCVLNCGGLPITSVWFDKRLSSDKSNICYLFVSVMPTKQTVPSKLSSTDLKSLSLSDFDSFDSTLIVYRYDTDEQLLQPVKNILTEHGAIIEMKQLLSSDLESSLIACVNSDGTAFVVKVDEAFLKGPRYSRLVKPSITLCFTEKDLSLKILCCSWTSRHTILVGTSEGCVAEFDITDTNQPLYILPLHVPSVLAVQSDYGSDLYGPEPCKPRSDNIFLSSGDLNVLLLDLNDPARVIEGPKFRIPVSNVCYSSIINGFIYADGTRTLKYSTVRDSSTSLKIRVYDEPPQSVCCSDYSPLVIAGCSNGNVRLLNFCNHVGQPLKSENAASLRIYKLSTIREGGDQFQLNIGYSLDRTDEPTTEYHPYENSLTVTSCSIMDRPDMNNIIFSCYANGLLIVEKLQDVIQEYK